ncbi:DNA polymerase subunit beta [Georgenia yuyongxinii]|uniref:DNA polymerase subunit beta n=1 Tax=Georgenia yuyongxinii TaxID=2589797 RepID=A0A5B8C8F5_9MICO|nr:DNA polymerase subunit beta [Georgenia yuyongxinii]QDC26337.1 DNA polymerase subunit beta [Georgenia yuyongxinii]
MTSGTALDREVLRDLAGRLVVVGGVVGVVLGESRARNDHHPECDVDLGLYYRPPLDVRSLAGIARDLDSPAATVTEPGAWGDWVDGGAWLRIGGVPATWVYRDLDTVARVWEGLRRGEHGFHHEAGHPLGVPDFAYVGELAVGAVLADPTGELTTWQGQFRKYPPALGEALVRGLWEATLLVEVAHKAVARRDVTYVAGCLSRAFLLCAHAIHGRAGQWLVNEKGAIAAADRLPAAPEGFAARAHGILAGLETGAESLEVALDGGTILIRDVAKRIHA